MRNKLFLLLVCLAFTLQSKANHIYTVEVKSTGKGKVKAYSDVLEEDKYIDVWWGAPTDKEWEEATGTASFTVKNTNWVYSLYLYYCLFAKPDYGYRFAGWSRTENGSELGKNTSYEVNKVRIEADNSYSDRYTTITYYAKFEPILYVWNGNNKQETKNARELNEWRKDNETSANLMAYALTDDSKVGLESTTNVVQTVLGHYICHDMVLTDKENYYFPYDFWATNFSYTREMTSEWGTLCVPFEIREWKDVEMYKLVDFNGNDLYLEQVYSLPAGTPAIIRKKGESNTIKYVDLSVDVCSTVKKSSDKVPMSGTFTNLKNKTGMYFVAQDKFWLAEDPITINAFRAWFDKPAASAAKSFNIRIAGEETVIENVCFDEQKNGKFVKNGKFIENGEVVVVKNGKKFNVNGQRVR